MTPTRRIGRPPSEDIARTSGRAPAGAVKAVASSSTAGLAFDVDDG